MEINIGGGLEGWPIPNILKVLERIGTLKPKMFGLIDFTAGYHQTPLHEKFERPLCFNNGGWALSMDSCGHGIKGSWALFSAQYGE